MNNQEKKIPFYTQQPTSLVEAVRALAAKERRTLTTQVQVIVEDYFERHGIELPEPQNTPRVVVSQKPVGTPWDKPAEQG